MSVPTFQSRSLIPVEAAGVALLTVIVAWSLAAPGRVPTWEQVVFEAFNDLPGWLFPLIWAPMQLGAIAGAALVASALVIGHRPACGAAYAAASAAAWLVALAIKSVVERGRPIGAGLADVTVRGVDPSGFGFISGHTAVAFAGATVIWVFFGRRLGASAYLLATLVGIARMYVGAHLPLDVAGGAAAGMIIGGAVTYMELRLTRIQARRSPSAPFR